MAEARLNFSDHPDGTFSCQAIWHGEFNPLSQSHQTIRTLQDFIDTIKEAVPDDVDDRDDLAEIEAGSRPTLPTQAFMHLTDVGDVFRMQLQYLPKESGLDQNSPAHQACLQAHLLLEHLNRAVSDAVVTRPGSVGIQAVRLRHAINAENGNY